MSDFEICNMGSCDQIADYNCSCGFLLCKDHFLNHMGDQIPNHSSSPLLIKLSDLDLQVLESSSFISSVIAQQILYKNQAEENLIQQLKKIRNISVDRIRLMMNSEPQIINLRGKIDLSSAVQEIIYKNQLEKKLIRQVNQITNAYAFRLNFIMSLKPFIVLIKEKRALPSVPKSPFIECLINLKKSDQLQISEINEKIHEILNSESTTTLKEAPDNCSHPTEEIKCKQDQFQGNCIFHKHNFRRRFKAVILDGAVCEAEYTIKNDNHGCTVSKFSYTSRYELSDLNEKVHRKGTYSFPNGNIYEGEFVDEEFEGYGVLTFADGGKHQGYYQNGKAHGKGIQWFSNGDLYEGEFANGEIQGYGVLTSANQEKHEGFWIKGKICGRKVITSKDGKRRKQSGKLDK